MNLKKKFSPYYLKHYTIPLYSLWYESTWERTIKAVKTCLYKTKGRVDYVDLTILTDVQ